MKGKEHKLEIRIAGTVDKSLDYSLAKSYGKLSRFSKSMAKLDSDFSKMDKVYGKFEKVGGKLFQALERGTILTGTALVGLATSSTMAGAKYEEAFAGVKKTTEATRKEYEALSKDVLLTTRLLPKSGEEIAKTAEIAGQLGVNKENLVDFTKVMENLGVSTNMTADVAADNLARFANITQMKDFDEQGISNYERLGSTIVDLGNNFSTTEEEIVEMSRNLASAGTLVNLTEAQILALGTAMSSLGLQADKGGSAMSKLLKFMQLSVETENKKLSQFASVSGISSKGFQDLFKKDSIGALSLFIKGLSDTKRNGKSAIATLDEMGLSEVRLSDAIQRLVTSGDLMERAIKRSNKAWSENRALTEEAEKKYQTFNSQLTFTKNAFHEAEIKIYQGLTRTPVVDVLGKVRNAVYDFTDNQLDNWLMEVNTSLPTFRREIEGLVKDGPLLAKLGVGVGKWAIDTGEWIVENGDYVLATLTGIGSAMAAYKVSSSTVHFLNSLSGLGSLSPIALGVSGIAVSAGIIVGAMEHARAYKERRVNESLAKTFGKISLSMKDMEKFSKSIIGDKLFEKLARSAEEFKKTDDMAKRLSDSLSDIEKRNWMAYVGVSFSEEDEEDYKANIDAYIKNAQDYILQERYALSVSLRLTQGEGSVSRKVDEFYNTTYLEMQKLGEELSKIVNDSFADNILNPDEIERIAEIQRKMADLQAKIATSDYDAGLIKLGAKFDGTKLDSDSFENLQEELGKQTEGAKEKYLEAYGRNVSAIQNTYDNKAMSRADYEKALETEKMAYLKNMAEVYEKSARFQVDTIQKAHNQGANAIFDKVIEENANKEAWEYTPDTVMERIRGEVLPQYADLERGSEKLMERLSKAKEELAKIEREYKELGISVPQTVSETLRKIEEAEKGLALGTGKIYDPVEFEKELGKRIGSSGFADTYQNIFSDVERKLKAVHDPVPKTFFDKVEEGFLEKSSKAFKEAHEGFAAFSTKYFKDWVNSKPFDFEADINMLFRPKMNLGERITPSVLNGGRTDSEFLTNGNLRVYRNARGGIWRKPILTTFAEEGAEAAIPIDGSNRAKTLWEETGRLLGMKRRVDGINLGEGYPEVKIEYKPTLQFYGEAPKKSDIAEALSMSQKEFDTLLDNAIKRRGRLAF